ncbi:MAG: DUF3078 domain-containing protein [Spirosomaceae bacterium]|jgi:hypothetical protein|nr:DUF3078 domain-containing protein [Spirosomataceae bacterium]
MRKSILIVSALVTFAINTFAQDAPLTLATAKNMADSLKVGFWKRGTQFGINFAQASFNDAWSGTQGGVGNIALGFTFNNRADYFKGKGVLTTDIQAQYGVLKNKGQDGRKAVDRLFLDAKYARKISPKLNWFANVNFLSQFAPGYKFDATGKRGNKISNLFAPGFLSEGVGVEWKPQKYLVVQLGGATIRQTIVSDDVVFRNTANKDGVSYGVPAGQNILNEVGFQAVAAFDKDIAKNLNLKWRYQGFLAYAPKSKPIDHFITLIATAKVNKYLNVNFNLNGVLDKDQNEKFQLAQGLNVGFLFTL